MFVTCSFSILRQNPEIVSDFFYPIPLLNRLIPPFNFIFPAADATMKPDQRFLTTKRFRYPAVPDETKINSSHAAAKPLNSLWRFQHGKIINKKNY